MNMECGSDLPANLGAAVQSDEEKLLPSKIKFVKWSSKMDLVAVVTCIGEILVHRLTQIKKVWSYKPTLENATDITTICWDPLGKSLAVALNNSQIMLLAVEKGRLIKTHHLAGSVKNLSWNASCNKVSRPTFSSSDILPELPQLDVDSDKTQVDMMMDTEESPLTFLQASCDLGQIAIFVNGLILLVNLDLNHSGLIGHTVLSTVLQPDLSVLVALTQSSQCDHHIVTVDVSLLEKRQEEIRTIFSKFIIIHQLIEYCQLTIKSMEEAWEENLLELDSKMKRFILQKEVVMSNTTVVNDFLELLLFGKASEELKNFLLDDLTERGMLKLGASLNSYYRTVNDLVCANLQSALEAIHYHIHELSALSTWTERYGPLGLAQEKMQTALQSSGSLILKTIEMTHMLTTGTHNLRQFAKWLYFVILGLSNKEVPEEMAQQPLDHHSVADFLRDNFSDAESTYPHMRLEKVGQYLKDRDLHYLAPFQMNNYDNRLQYIMHESKLVYSQQRTKSLVQLFKRLRNDISDAFAHPSVTVGRSFTVISTPSAVPEVIPNLHKILKVRQFSSPVESVVYTVIHHSASSDAISDAQLDIVTCTHSTDWISRCARVHIGCMEQCKPELDSTEYTILDFDFYKNSSLMLLLQSGSNSLTAQVDLSLVSDSLASSPMSPVDLGPYIARETVSLLHNTTTAQAISVNGARKVGMVLLSDRRVKTFLYEQEEEPEEDETMDITEGDVSATAAEGSDKEN